MIQDLASLMWAANLVVEFHTPQWRADAPEIADRMVFDLDPGSPATVVECCVVAGWLRERLAADGLFAYGKTSGSKGLHLLVPLQPARPPRCPRTPGGSRWRRRTPCPAWPCTG